jgi:outer membrane protein OmpA-like peptidoglycan-associated protein
VELQLEEVSVDADRDGDGIPDQDDICPDQPETVDLVEDQDGCPELDGDQDGVPFAKDNCPTQPTLPGQDPRYSDGCPRVAELAGDRIVITETIFFEEGKSVLMPGSERVLSAILNILQEHPTLGPVLVAGHTNVNGSDSFNLRLSDARAFEVMRWLVDHGIEPERLVSKGFGEEFPLVPESNPDAERINRRVEFQVLNAGIPEGARRVQLSPEALAARAARQTEPPVIVEVPVSAPVTPPEPVAEEKKEEPTRPRRKPADTSDHR